LVLSSAWALRCPEGSSLGTLGAEHDSRLCSEERLDHPGVQDDQTGVRVPYRRAASREMQPQSVQLAVRDRERELRHPDPRNQDRVAPARVGRTEEVDRHRTCLELRDLGIEEGVRRAADELEAHEAGEQLDALLDVADREFDRRQLGSRHLVMISSSQIRVHLRSEAWPGPCQSPRTSGEEGMPSEITGRMAPRGLFVVGSPRSGTTLLGNYLGSSPAVLNMGEFGGFLLAYSLALTPTQACAEVVRAKYLSELSLLARTFADLLAEERGSTWWCDSGPWNVLVADQIAAQVDDALFVLALRHFAGVVQSMRRVYEEGQLAAGATWAESTAVWRDHFSAVARLPRDRTVVVSYDALTSDPSGTLSMFRAELEEHGFDTSGLDSSELVLSHAASTPRPTIGTMEGDEVRLRPIPSFDEKSWSGDIHAAVWPVAREVHCDLKSRFGELYRSPPPPSQLYVHDETLGLCPASVREW
jgi:Sulfotransferase family